MKTFFRTGMIFLAGLTGVAVAADVKVHVQGSQELRLAIVDSSRQTPARDTLHAAFASSLAEAINQGGGAPISVKLKSVSADNAAFNLGTGVFDTVLVIGNSLPRALISSETKRLTATLSSGKGEIKAFLIFGENDQGLSGVLTAAFTPAITSQRFLDALDGGIERFAGAEGGSKVAARP